MGLIVLFSGMLVPVYLMMIINHYSRSEGERFQQSQKSLDPLARIRKRETMLRHILFLRNHSSVVFLFLLGALLVAALMVMAPVMSPEDWTSWPLRLIKIVLGLAYLALVVFCFYLVFTKRWAALMDGSVRNAEQRLAEAKLESAEPKA